MDKIYDIIDHQLILDIAGKKVSIDLRQTIWPCSTFSILYILFWRKSGFKDLSKIKQQHLQSAEHANSDDEPYQKKPVNIPPLNGWMSVLYRRMLRSPLGRLLLLEKSKSQGGLNVFLDQLDIPDKPTFYPIVYPDESQRNKKTEINLNEYIDPSKDSNDFHFNTISDYITAYRNGITTPLQVAERIIQAIKLSESQTPKLRIIIQYKVDDILQRAAESTERWKKLEPLSVFDGIPVSVKDEFFLAGYPCRSGTSIEILSHDKELSDEGLMVSKLRAGGAVFIGIANMHQLGVGITGINPSRNHGTCRNPYNTKFPPGGSSSGPAASVAAGLCPVALGADGGGSIRIPSAVCGVVGAKASFGRISGNGLHRNCDTVGHAGALCATVRDAVIAYGFIAGPDPKFEVGMIQPPCDIDQFSNIDLTGIKVGIDWAFFNDCAPEIIEICKKGVEFLRSQRNAEIVEISIPEIPVSQRAHVVTTLTEMYTAGIKIFHNHHDELNMDTENSFMFGKSFHGSEYYQAQKQRTRCMNIFRRLFKEVDCIITPTFGEFMPELNEDILRNGFTNLKHVTDVIRFCVLGNLTGNPSISVPVGYSSTTGLPVGILIQTGWWKENLMFRIANSMSECCTLRRPETYYDVLN